MLPSYVIVTGVVVLIILVVIGIWYFFSEDEAPEDEAPEDEAPEDEAPAKDDQGVESTLSETSATTKTDTQTAIATESTTTIVPPEDISDIEDVVPSEQIEFVNNKQSQIKTFLSTEFGFLNSLNA
jgi:FtsZ-interacting cell division protein ZipA